MDPKDLYQPDEASPYLPRGRVEAPTPQQHAEAIDLRQRALDAELVYNDNTYAMRIHRQETERLQHMKAGVDAALEDRNDSLESLKLETRDAFILQMEIAMLRTRLVDIEALQAYHTQGLIACQDAQSTLRLAVTQAQAAWEVWEGTRSLRDAQNTFGEGLKQTQAELARRMRSTLDTVDDIPVMRKPGEPGSK